MILELLTFNIFLFENKDLQTDFFHILLVSDEFSEGKKINGKINNIGTAFFNLNFYNPRRFDELYMEKQMKLVLNIIHRNFYKK